MRCRPGPTGKQRRSDGEGPQMGHVRGVTCLVDARPDVMWGNHQPPLCLCTAARFEPALFTTVQQSQWQDTSEPFARWGQTTHLSSAAMRLWIIWKPGRMGQNQPRLEAGRLGTAERCCQSFFSTEVYSATAVIILRSLESETPWTVHRKSHINIKMN